MTLVNIMDTIIKRGRYRLSLRGVFIGDRVKSNTKINEIISKDTEGTVVGLNYDKLTVLWSNGVISNSSIDNILVVNGG